MGFGPPGGDQPDIVPAPTVDNHQYPTGGIGSKSDKTLLDGVRLVIDDRDSQRIFKNQGSVGKTYRVFGNIGCRFFRILEDRHDSVYAQMYTVRNVRRPSWADRSDYSPRVGL